MTPAFDKFIKNHYTGRILSVDPGGTTGIAKWINEELKESDQLDTHTMVKAYKEFYNEFTFWNPAVLIIEEYRVYAHKTEDHAHNDMHTSRVIGLIECMCIQRGIPYVFQKAADAKKFVTDDKLRDWGFWQIGERHARDAIRHGAYWLCHGKPI